MTSCRTKGLTLTLRQHLESSPRGQPESNLKTRERKMHNVHDHRHDQHPHRHVLPLELVELDLSLGFAGQHRTRYRSSQLRDATRLIHGTTHSPDRGTARRSWIEEPGPRSAPRYRWPSSSRPRGTSELSTGQDTQPDTHEGLFRGRQSFSITPCQARIGSVPEQPSRSSDMTAQTTRTTLASSSHSRLADGGATSAQII